MEAPGEEEPAADAVVLPAGTLSLGSTSLQLYARPDTASEVLFRFEPGTVVQLFSQDGAWALVAYNGLQGYILTENIVVAAPEEPFDLNKLSVRVYFVGEPDEVEIGDTLTLQAVLVGFEKMPYSYTVNWQQAGMNENREIGSNWADIPGADSLTHTLKAQEANEFTAYRLAVRVAVPVKEGGSP